MQCTNLTTSGVTSDDLVGMDSDGECSWRLRIDFGRLRLTACSCSHSNSLSRSILRASRNSRSRSAARSALRKDKVNRGVFFARI